MKRITPLVLGAIVVALVGTMFSSPARADDPPDDRIVAIYFHRTQRCPTCLKMGSYAEEAVTDGFSDQVKDGTVEFHFVDFQDTKNAALAKAYGISGPALVVAKVTDKKVEKFENLKDIWSKVGDKDDFIEYVTEQVEAYRK